MNIFPEGAAVDPSDDFSGNFTRLVVERYGIPDFVADAPRDSLLRKRAADGAPAGRKFPSETPAQTWLSCAFAVEQLGRVPPETVQRLKSACDFHGLAGVWDKLNQIKAASTPPPSRHALSGPNRYPLGTDEEVDLAVRYFDRERTKMARSVRKEFAFNLLEALVEKDAIGRVPEESLERIQKSACAALADADLLKESLHHRRRFLVASDPDVAEVYAKAAEAVDSLSPERCEEMMDAVDEDDRRREIFRYDGFRPIEDEVYGTTVKAAADRVAGTVFCRDGSSYRAESLDSVPPGVVREVFLPDELIVGRDKVASALASASREELPVWHDLLRRHGVRPECPPPRVRVDWKELAGS